MIKKLTNRLKLWQTDYETLVFSDIFDDMIPFLKSYYAYSRNYESVNKQTQHMKRKIKQT